MGVVPVPLVQSKYRVPARRPGAVARPRLARRLAEAARAPLTLLSAPAGFGKTTLLTEWLATLDGPAVAWLSLDRRDNDPRLFWTYLVTALHAAVDAVGVRALPLLESSAGTEAVLATVLNDLNALPHDLVLVLDDYHLVEAAEVHDGLAFLLEHQPPQLHLVLATRADPRLPLAGMRAGGRLLEVRAAELRFTAEEAAAYLNGSMGLALTAGDVTALDRRTEGWIAALQLAALSMQGRDDAAAFIEGFAGDDRYVVDYLAEEVLDRQPADVRAFLLRTSVLDRLTGPLCDAVTGQDGGRARLVALERANLFLVPLDDRRRWYRYHHLFGEVLQAHLGQEHGGEVSELHRRAGAWFAGQDEPAAAVEHFVAGRDFERAADLMELAAPIVSRSRQEATLRRWLTLLPDEVVAARPVLGVSFAGALAQGSEFATVPGRLAGIERRLRPDGEWLEQPPDGVVVVDPEGYRRLPAQVAMYRAALALNRGALDETVRHARASISLAPPEDHLARGGAAALAGLACWAGGDLTGAHDGYTEAVRALERAGYVSDVLGCSVTLGDIARTRGQLGAALATYRRALALAAEQPGAPLRGTADMYTGIAGVLLERGDLAGAAGQLATGRDLGEGNGLPQDAYRRRVVEARLRAAGGDLDAALALLERADRVYDGDYSPNVRPVPALLARLRIRRGEPDPAREWAREQGLSADDELSYRRECEHLTLARLLLAEGRPDQAGSLLDRLLAAARDGGRDGSVVEILLLRALARQARGDGPGARAVLLEAVAAAEPEGYVQLFADEGPPLAALLRSVPGRSPYLRRLLAATGAPAPARPVQALADPLSERELDVLRLLGSELDGPDIARRLSVSLNTMRTHTKNIYAKLGVGSRRAAVSRAQELGLLR
jgi:LuxR family maltose regulon positive regulatory protein